MPLEIMLRFSLHTPAVFSVYRPTSYAKMYAVYLVFHNAPHLSVDYVPQAHATRRLEICRTPVLQLGQVRQRKLELSPSPPQLCQPGQEKEREREMRGGGWGLPHGVLRLLIPNVSWLERSKLVDVKGYCFLAVALDWSRQ